MTSCRPQKDNNKMPMPVRLNLNFYSRTVINTPFDEKEFLI